MEEICKSDKKSPSQLSGPETKCSLNFDQSSVQTDSTAAERTESQSEGSDTASEECSSDNDDEHERFVSVEVDSSKPQWDCESILRCNLNSIDIPCVLSLTPPTYTQYTLKLIQSPHEDSHTKNSQETTNKTLNKNRNANRSHSWSLSQSGRQQTRYL